MKRELALELTRVTESVGLACYSWIGRGNKNKADNAAVKAMRRTFNTIDFKGKVVIGEGEIDEAPMLYIGEVVGNGTNEVDIAVDPIDGTRMVALGQENAVAVLVCAPKNTLLQAPDMYMEKLMVGAKAKGHIDIDKPIIDNVKNVAKALKKEVSEVTVLTLAKPRHEKVIKEIQDLGCKVIAIPDGDVAGSISVAMPNTTIDLFYGIGGAPEGIISAAIMNALDGDMQAKLKLRTVKGQTKENQEQEEVEKKRCQEMKVEVNKKLILSDLCNADDVIVSMTGITKGTHLEGVSVEGDYATTETILIRGKTRTVRKIQSNHYLPLKDSAIKELINKGE